MCFYADFPAATLGCHIQIDGVPLDKAAGRVSGKALFAYMRQTVFCRIWIASNVYTKMEREPPNGQPPFQAKAFSVTV